uniref:Glutathione S-transferase omega-1 n=1 Tax=Anoplophora glabripennis TaxID=217634 RepID=V5GSN4_ANOGL
MSSAHLTIGSQEPPRVESLLRLYSMKFCPFAQRTRLVLNAKGIPHDIVNINLIKKPEWYFKIHPEGKVPALLDGSKVIVESLDISDYLDEKYPENPLYPVKPELKKRDKDLINKIGAVTQVFGQCVFTDMKKTPEEWLKDFLVPLQDFEDALAQRGTPFFGGEKPEMVDYMLWPWAEKTECIEIKQGTKLPVKDDQIPLLRKWRKTMRDYPIVKEIYTPPEVFWKVAECKLTGTEPKYDDL